MEEVYCATGRRKKSVARIRIRKGEGKFLINGKEASDYLKREVLKVNSNQPIVLTEYEDKLDITARVFGGGLSGQAGAIRHGISKALLQLDSELRPALKKAGFIRRDPRVKERKKYGQKGARARFQFSKR